MKKLTILRCKYCSWCEAISCKNNSAKCYKASKKLLSKRMRQKDKKEIRSELV